MRRTFLPTLLLGLAACGDSAPPAGTAAATGTPPRAKPLVVGYSQIGAESSWRQAETTSIKIEAQKRGIDLKLSDAQQKLENQIQALHGFVAQQVDVVLLSPKSEKGFEPALRELAAAKIPVVLVDRGVDCDPSLYATLIASDFVAEGRMAARWLIDQTQGPVRVVELEGSVGSAPAIDRKKGFHEEIAKEPRVQVVRSQMGDFNLIQGKEVMEAVLRSEKEPFHAVYAHNDDMALGAIQALEAAGKKPGTDIHVVSIDATRGAFDAILAGKLSAAVECSPLLGPLAFDAAEKLARGEKVEPRIVVQDRVFDATNARDELASRRY
jgi:galactofuranose transport system substrate-binding protein